MAPGWAVLVVLVLSTLRACGARPLEQSPRRGLQWVWGVAEQMPAEPPLPSRRRRADDGQLPNGTAATQGHGRAITAMPISNETDSPAPDSLLGSTLQPELGTNTSLPRLLTTLPAARALDETDSPEPDLLLGTEPPLEPGTNASLPRALVVTTVDPLDETDSPDPDLLPSSAPAPGTEAASQNNSTIVPSCPLSSGSPGTGGTTAGGTDNISPVEPRSAPPPSTAPTTTVYKKAGAPPMLNQPGEANTAPSDTKPGGEVVAEAPTIPWDNNALINKCLLAILLLGLVAAAFMVCTGVLAALLCRRAQTARHRLSPTEMVCISSLLPDSEPTVTNGPRLGPPRRHKLLADASSEADGDNLTLNSFLPEHS